MVLCSVIVIAQKVAEKCVDQIVGHIGTEVGHLLNYNANLKKLEEEVGHLSDATRRMEARILDARNRSGETQVDAGAARWLTDMAHLTEEASRIIREEDRETGRCLMGLRPNLLACYRASISAEKVMESAEKLKNDGESFTTVAHVDYSQALGFAINPDYEELESRKKSSEQIIAYLKDPTVRIVGMYGMGGTGKTTLAEKMGVQLYEDETFRYVVKTNVSNNEGTDLLHIQKQIADLLKISFQDDKGDVMARANHLREQLLKKEKVLIILDDVWSNFDLRNVGLPLDRDLTILITSRDVNVMNRMNSNHNVPLDVLSPEDSWKLFDKMANGVAQDADHYSTALEVVKQCGGIPVLLVTIASTLKNTDLEIWKEALFQLKTFEGDNFVEDGYKKLEVSYNFLPNSELKLLFLLCAQLDHHSICIEDLLRYTMGLDLLNRKKLCDVRSRLHMHLNRLKGYCLLQDGITEKGERIVRMHDVVHKFATSIAFRDHHIFSTVAGFQLQEWPSKNELEQFSAISLPYCFLPPDSKLPVAFESSKLKSFLLLRRKNIWRGYNFPKVPNEFFTGMKELKLIDIKTMSLSLSSLNVLVKLRTLCIEYCELDDVAVVIELPMLQVLSLKGSKISQIRSLGNSLKLLDLSDCHPRIFHNVLSNLTLLEDLCIGFSFDKWEPLQGCNSGTHHETLASVREFKNLKNLINLDILIPDTKAFSKDLALEKLESYRITIGCRHHLLPENSKSLAVSLGEDSSQVYERIRVLMEKVKHLYIEELVGFTSVCEMVPKGLPELMSLDFHYAGIECIVRKIYDNCTIFPKLERLKLFSCKKLERICDGYLVLPDGSFQNLTAIEVDMCNLLPYIFSSHMALRLSCLKEIEVFSCNSVESIIARESGNRITEAYHQLDEEEIIEFSQLRKIRLHYLPRFISFFCSPTISSSQEKQEQDDPTSSNQLLLTSVFNKKVVLPKLEELELMDMGVDQIWDDQFTTEAGRINYWWVHNLTILTIERCHNLSYLFTSSMVKSLAQLQKIKVCKCRSIEEIVATRKGEEDGKFSFPALEKLEFRELPKLKRFCGGPNLLDFPRLLDLDVHDCERLIDPLKLNIQNVDASLAKIFTSPSLEYYQLKGKDFNVAYSNRVKKLIANGGGCSLVSPIVFVGLIHELEKMSISSFRFEQLFTCEAGVDDIWPKHLTLSNLSDMKHIWHEHSADDQCHWFPQNLESLEVSRCGSLMSLAPKSAWFPNLTRLVVTRCNELIQLVSSTIAKSLVNLTEMVVSNCDSLIEIVAIYDDHVREEASNNIEKIVATNKEMTRDRLEEEIIEFTQLRELRLINLGGFISFFGGPIISLSQEMQEQDHTSLFNKKVVLPKLDKLELDDINVHQIWEDRLPFEAERINCRFHNLTIFKVISCHNLRYLFTSSMIKSLARLKELEVQHCKSIEEIVATKRDEDDDVNFSFPSLQTLNFSDLQKLKRFCHKAANLLECRSLQRLEIDGCPELNAFVTDGGSSSPLFHNAAFPNLEILTINHMHHVKMIWKNNLNLNLHEVNINNCSSLTSIFSSPVPLALQQLQRLAIGDCENLKEIVSNLKEGGPRFVFPKLTALNLRSLPELERLCGGPNLLNFPSLVKLHVNGCERLIEPFKFNIQNIDASLAKIFTSPSLEFYEIKGEDFDVTYACQSLTAHGGGCSLVSPFVGLFHALRNISISSFRFEQLFEAGVDDGHIWPKHLTLSNLSDMKHIWPEHSADDQCHEFPQNLESLEVNICGSLMSLAPKSAWFPNLTRLAVSGCNELKMLVSSTTAKSLVNLTEMVVSKCDSLIEIVARDEDEGDVNFSFPSLRTLNFSDLQKLKRFCHNANLLECRSLKRLEIDGCPELNGFVTNGCSSSALFHNTAFPNLVISTINNCSSLTSIFSSSVPQQLQSLAIGDCENLKEIVSNLEEGGPRFVFPELTALNLRSLPELERFCGGPNLLDFPNLDDINVDGCERLIEPFKSNIQNIDASLAKIFTTPSLNGCQLTGTNFGIVYHKWQGYLALDGGDYSLVSPIAFFELFQELETVCISNFRLEHLFPCEPDVDDDRDINTQTIARDDQSYRIPLNLKKLGVQGCGILTSLAPESALFPNLTRLAVVGCNDLIYLFSSTTAKSLVNLIAMDVRECDSLIEIVAVCDDHDGEEGSNDSTEDIVFGKLETLVLYSLRSLTSFTANDCNFQFPSLEQVTVEECPNMAYFCRGDLSTPKLRSE